MPTSPVHGQTLIVQMMLDAKARPPGGAGSSKTIRARAWGDAVAQKQSANVPTSVHSMAAQRVEAESAASVVRRATTSPVRDPRVIDHAKFARPRLTPPHSPRTCPGARPIPTPPTPPSSIPPAPESPVVPDPAIPPDVPVVESPAGPTPTVPADAPGQTIINHAIVLDNAMNQTVADLANDGQDFGVVVGNGQHSENIILDNITATNCTDYGVYLGDVANWSINNSTFHQAAGANQHGMRIGYGQNISIDNTTVDSSLAGKSSLWLVDVTGATVTNSTFMGGAIRFGSPPGTGLGEPTAQDISITHSTISKTSGGDLEAILAWPGSHNIHLSDLDITLETSQHWLAIDSRNTSNITWSNIRVNGQLINGFEGVGTNEPIEDLLMRGIGPVAQCV